MAEKWDNCHIFASIIVKKTDKSPLTSAFRFRRMNILKIFTTILTMKLMFDTLITRVTKAR
jgi:hypothetical protein